LRPGQWSSELRPERIERCRKLERNEAETLAAARGKQTGVGVKGRKKERNESERGDTKQEEREKLEGRERGRGE